MVDVDLEMLERALRPSPLKIGKHGIDSTRSRVENIASLFDEVSADRLVRSFENVLGCKAQPAILDPAIHDQARYLKSHEWVFGEAPAFDVTLERVIEGDLYTLCLDIQKGVIRSAHIYTDALNAPDLDAACQRLVGKRFPE